MGIHFKGILVVLLLLLPNLIFFVYPPQNVPENSGSVSVVITIIEQVGRVVCFTVPIVFGKKIAQQNMSLTVVLMVVCLLVYYLCWIIYFSNGRQYYDLFKPIGFIPIPMAIFPLLYLVLLGVWVESPIFIIPAVLFSIGHITVSWKTYTQLLNM